MNKFEELFQKYNCNIADNQIKEEVEQLLTDHFEENNTPSTYKQCLGLIDLTSLNSTDTEEQIVTMTQKINGFKSAYPDLPNVGAICVFPSMVATVKANLEPHIGIASVAAGFPASQTFIEIKIAETSMAVMEGASEIDIVISIGKFLSGQYDEVREELQEIKDACRGSHLKVIIESGALQTASNIKKASILAMSAGADFIKTSTGKIPVAATPEATYIMCTAIKEWHEHTGERIGFKPAGGIVTTQDAVKHYTIVKEVLGEEWLNNKLFRIGASRLANNLLSKITGEEVHYF
jgi:deoxyribose-phosphate aldolase